MRIDAALLATTTERACVLPRLRANHNLHSELTDPVQRLLNAIEPDSYVRPHRHLAPPRWELFVILAGHAVVLVFDDDGEVLERLELVADGDLRAVELPEGCWHTVAALAAGTVLFEVKQGPYTALPPEGMAPWAPAEGDARCAELTRWFCDARPGDRIPR